MTIEVNGKTIETTDNGYLVNLEEWNEDVATQLAFVGVYGKEAEMSGRWGHKVSNKEMFDFFPGNPSKQAGLIAGLPESLRKGGY